VRRSALRQFSRRKNQPDCGRTVAKNIEAKGGRGRGKSLPNAALQPVSAGEPGPDRAGYSKQKKAAGRSAQRGFAQGDDADRGVWTAKPGLEGSPVFRAQKIRAHVRDDGKALVEIPISMAVGHGKKRAAPSSI